MAIRYKALTELYQETQRKVTAPAEWQQFLTSACRNYRLSFDEQLLVYAQRPDATAVLEIERWNKRFGRWVNRGANGIAVFDGEHTALSASRRSAADDKRKYGSAGAGRCGPSLTAAGKEVAECPITG